MNFGAFAGGLARGIESGTRLADEQRRTALAEQESQRAQERQEVWKSQQQKEQAYEADVADITRRHLTQTDETTGQSVPVDITKLPLNDQIRLNMQMTSEMVNAGMKHGRYDPRLQQQMLALGQQLEQNGQSEAIRKFAITQDPKYLAPLAQKLGVDPATMKVTPTQGPWGLTQTVSGVGPDKQPFSLDIGKFYTALGAYDLAKAESQSRDDQRQSLVAQSQIKSNEATSRLREAQIGATNALASQRNAKAAGAGKAGAAAGGNFAVEDIYKYLKNWTPTIPGNGLDGKDKPDVWAKDTAATLAEDFGLSGRHNNAQGAAMEAKRVVQEIIKTAGNDQAKREAMLSTYRVNMRLDKPKDAAPAKPGGLIAGTAWGQPDPAPASTATPAAAPAAPRRREALPTLDEMRKQGADRASEKVSGPLIPRDGDSGDRSAITKIIGNKSLDSITRAEANRLRNSNAWKALTPDERKVVTKRAG